MMETGKNLQPVESLAIKSPFEREDQLKEIHGTGNGNSNTPPSFPCSRISPDLLESHYLQLKGSALTDEVIMERGYLTILRATKLKDKGFSNSQGGPPGLLLPVHAPDGSQALCQFRPDNPRTNSRGKKVKYETPAKAGLRIDVPPRCRAKLGDPGTRLWITEGIKKGDALASAGECAIGLLGVYGFKHKNEFGVVTISADLDYIAWKGRDVYIAYDNDVMVNPQVKKAMETLSEHLKRKGASVYLVYIPLGDGNKVGVDDYLAGHTIEDLLAYAVQEDAKIAKAGAEFITLANRTIKPREWLLEGAIPRGYVTTIFGAGGLGKSLLALNLATLACIGGQRFMGLRFPLKGLNVLYVDFELEDNEQTRRAQEVASGLNLPDVPGNLTYVSPGTSLSRFLPQLKQEIQTRSIEFVVIDSFGASGTDGESVQDVVGLFTELKRLGVTILLLDHQSKMQAKEDYNQKTPFGSVYKENLSRSVFQLSRVEAHDNMMTLRLRHTKTNFGKFQDDLIFDMSFEGDKVLFTQSQVQPPEAREAELILNVIQALEADGRKVNQKALTEHFKGEIGEGRLRTLLNQGEGELWDSEPGERKEKLYKSKTSKPQTLCNRGSEVLENDCDDYEIPEEFFDEHPNYEGDDYE